MCASIFIDRMPIYDIIDYIVKRYTASFQTKIPRSNTIYMEHSVLKSEKRRIVQNFIDCCCYMHETGDFFASLCGLIKGLQKGKNIKLLLSLIETDKKTLQNIV